MFFRDPLFSKECISALALLPTRNFTVLKVNVLQYNRQELKFSACTKFLNFFTYLLSVELQQDAFSYQGRMLIRQNRNNDNIIMYEMCY